MYNLEECSLYEVQFPNLLEKYIDSLLCSSYVGIRLKIKLKYKKKQYKALSTGSVSNSIFPMISKGKIFKYLIFVPKMN